MSSDQKFLTGVVEGFYGKPWTYPQRKELFRRMNHMAMNSYLYAPKDDVKHRKSWRELYTPEEEHNMRSLIHEATESGILFIFALSPGLDVTFSSDKEIELLKKKVDQISRLGCRAFALLFDDIEPRLCTADAKIFSSSARAQVTLVNDLYKHLNNPDVFLFCPTEYSGSLAVPNIVSSEYLSTVSKHLDPDISVVWTGSLVVSKQIGVGELEQLADLLKHPIVIWDNLHANDYDQRRVFIGPYSGRSLDLRRRSLIRGVLTNPNIEFEANYVALHTLAQWSRLGESMQSSSELMNDGNREMADDDKGDSKQAQSVDSTVDQSLDYNPRQALLLALSDWLKLMFEDQQLALHPSRSIPSTGNTPTPMDTDADSANGDGANEMQVEPCEVPTGKAVSNGFGSDVALDASACIDVTLDDLVLFADLFYLPFSHGPTGIQLLELGRWLLEHAYECGPDAAESDAANWHEKLAKFVEIVASIGRMLDRLQRLPSRCIAFELAPYAFEILNVLCIVLDYFKWLATGIMADYTMCHLRRILTWLTPGSRSMITSGEQEPWTIRGGLITELQGILPLESAQDLFPAPCRTFPDLSIPDNNNDPNLTLPPASATPIPTLTGGDSAAATGQEVVNPILIPPTNTLNFAFQQQSVFYNRSPRMRAYEVRPYRVDDKPALYTLIRRLLLARAGLPEDALPSELLDLPGDRYLLAYLEHSPKGCLVVEGLPFVASEPADGNTDNDSVPRSIIGFGVSTPDAVELAKVRNQLMRSTLSPKYQQQLTVFGSETGQPVNVKAPMAYNDFVKFLLAPLIQANAGNAVNGAVGSCDIADASVMLPPPIPLGGSLEHRPALNDTEPEASNLPPPLIPDSAPPSPKPSHPPSTSQVVPTIEALHSALTSHPAALWLEFDDLALPIQQPSAPPSAHSLYTESPQLILDSLARRLLIVSMAALKTVGAQGVHVQIDGLNEARAELYRRYGFYPIPAASTEQKTVYARLI